MGCVFKIFVVISIRMLTQSRSGYVSNSPGVSEPGPGKQTLVSDDGFGERTEPESLLGFKPGWYTTLRGSRI